MLVLSRRLSEEVVIRINGYECVVTLVEIGRDKVRLGFTAESAVKIHRRELLERADVREEAD